MAKSEGQKLKLFHILRILREETNEEHHITTEDLIDMLDMQGIKAERKTIYSDIDALRDYGYDIILDESRSNRGYYLASREFELAELKMLIDMIQSSRFLSENRSRKLIRKIEGFASRFDARGLKRSVYVANRAKSVNDTVFYTVDSIYRAIQQDESVAFQYQDYTIDKGMQLRAGGKTYHVSPYFLTWSNENYYLVGFDESREEIRNYRVDRMKNLRLSDEKRKGKEAFKDFDIVSYSGTMFNMFGGEEARLTLRFKNELSGVVFDRFGKDINPKPEKEGYFTLTVNVVPSGQFYGWLAGLGTGVRIISPAEQVRGYEEYLNDILLDYFNARKAKR